MKKGMVTKITNDYALVLSDDMKYEKIKLKTKMNVGEKIYYFKEDIFRDNLRRKTYNISALIASFLIIAIVGSLIVFSPSKSAYAGMHAVVTVDINPSIELIIDFDEKVTEIKALNDDAGNIINDDMLGLSLEDVLEILLENARLQDYLLEDDAILISSVILNERDEEDEEEVIDEEDKEDLEEKLNAFMEKKQEQYTFLYVKGTQEALRASNSNGLSLGKYEMLKFFNEEITKEEIKNMKVTAITERKEIKEQLKQQKGIRYIHSNEKEKVTFDEEEDTEEDVTNVKDKDHGKDSNGTGNNKDKDNQGNGNNPNIEDDKDNQGNGNNPNIEDDKDNQGKGNNPNIDDNEDIVNGQGNNDEENGKGNNGQGKNKSNNHSNKG